LFQEFARPPLGDFVGISRILRCPGVGVCTGWILLEIVALGPFMPDISEIQRHLPLKKADKTNIKDHNKLLAPTVQGTEARNPRRLRPK